MKRIKLENNQKSSVLSIISLPNDVLLEIFQHFDENSLKSALNVCQNWAQIIKSSPSLSKGLTIKIQQSVKNDQNILSILIPIDGLMYRKLHVIGQMNSDLNNDELSDLLQTYSQNIRYLVIEDFTCNEKFIEKFQNVSKLKSIGKFDRNVISSFKNLTHLDLRINSFNELSDLKHEKFNLKIFKIILKQSASLNVDESEIFSDFLRNQNSTLKEVSIIGLKIDTQIIKKSLKFENLTKFEFEIDMLEDGQQEVFTNIFFGQKWTTFKIVNPKINHKSFISKAAEICKNIKTISITYTDAGFSLPSSSSIFDEIPNFKSGLFSFMTSKSTNDYFIRLQELSIKRVDNESQLKKLIKFLENCQNLKILHLNLVSNRAKLDKNLTEIINSCRSLEQLQIDAYSDKLDISTDTFDDFKSLNTNLKKLIIKVGNQQVQEMKEKCRKLIDTKIQTIVMEKEIHRTCLDNDGRNQDKSHGICILMK